MVRTLLFGGVPGGPELLIILLVVVVLLGVPLAVLVLGGALGFSISRSSRDRERDREGADRSAGGVDERRVDELERELAETRAELERLREERDSGGDGGDDADADERR